MTLRSISGSADSVSVNSSSSYTKTRESNTVSESRQPSLPRVSDVDAASLCSSPSSLKVRLRNTFLEFKEETEIPVADIDSPRADSMCEEAMSSSPLRRSQSDVTGVDLYIRQRLGSNAGVPLDTLDVEADSGFSPAGQLSPMSYLGHRGGAPEGAVSILSFSPPTFQHSPFGETRTSPADFELVMEEDPPAPKLRPPTLVVNNRGGTFSSHSTQPSTPTLFAPPSSVSTEGRDDRTTVMLRNIPNKYTQRMLLEEVNTMGFEGQYDFFYLPIDYRNKCNVGYCFVSFTANETARRFIAKLSGYKLPGFNSQKICEVSWARVQGLKANIQHYRNSPVNSINIPEYRPLLFAHGTEIQFPFVNNRAL